MSQLLWLDNSLTFPDIEQALDDPNGLLAVGGDLSTERLIAAYEKGIFPWFSDDQPPLWWSPDPRCVLFPDKVHISKSLRKLINKKIYRASFDLAFEQVIQACAFGNRKDDGTWITPDMLHAYCEMHEIGLAHSVEIWQDKDLVGGLYGIAMGRCFFGESMFSKATNTSKIAFAYLSRQLEAWGYQVIDCQVENPHLITLGAETIPRKQFLSILKEYAHQPCPNKTWQFELEDIPVFNPDFDSNA